MIRPMQVSYEDEKMESVRILAQKFFEMYENEIFKLQVELSQLRVGKNGT